MQIMSGIFKAYDIRGVVPTDLNRAMAEKIGQAYAVFTGAKKVVVGRDMRPHSQDMFDGLAAGLVKMGREACSSILRSSERPTPFIPSTRR